jgi:hypothetical protein
MTNTKTTVAELIEKLKEFDQNARIVLWHHWGDYKDLNLSQIQSTKINHYKKQEYAVKLS